jgi:hypothetical protein
VYRTIPFISLAVLAAAAALIASGAGAQTPTPPSEFKNPPCAKEDPRTAIYQAKHGRGDVALFDERYPLVILIIEPLEFVPPVEARDVSKGISVSVHSVLWGDSSVGPAVLDRNISVACTGLEAGKRYIGVFSRNNADGSDIWARVAYPLDAKGLAQVGARAVSPEAFLRLDEGFVPPPKPDCLMIFPDKPMPSAEELRQAPCTVIAGGGPEVVDVQLPGAGSGGAASASSRASGPGEHAFVIAWGLSGLAALLGLAVLGRWVVKRKAR